MRFSLPRPMHLVAFSVLPLGLWLPGSSAAAQKEKSVMRIAAAQPKNRTIDFKLKPAEVLARVDQSLDELEKIIDKAGAAGCDALALPEDTLGLLKWEVANPTQLQAILPEAVGRMLRRLGES